MPINWDRPKLILQRRFPRGKLDNGRRSFSPGWSDVDSNCAEQINATRVRSARNFVQSRTNRFLSREPQCGSRFCQLFRSVRAIEPADVSTSHIFNSGKAFPIAAKHGQSPSHAAAIPHRKSRRKGNHTRRYPIIQAGHGLERIPRKKILRLAAAMIWTR
jgi:hypothetical protein